MDLKKFFVPNSDRQNCTDNNANSSRFKPVTVNAGAQDEVARLIGYYFRDQSLLELALTHRSYVRAQSTDHPSNERLEFLGDSVLGLVIARQLFEDYPDMSEGDLTKLRALLVNETTLSRIGIEIGINRHILLSPEEDRSGGRLRPSIVSDTLESIIGAVFLDGGFGCAKDVVLRGIYTRRDKILADSSQRNFKGELLEWVQGIGQGMPRYDVITETGPDHDKTFRIEVTVENKTVGCGEGSSKKEAEQGAARQALNNLRQNNQ